MGGGLLDRWGNPEACGAGTSTDRVPCYQHDARWITEGLEDEGNIMLFNNGLSASPAIFQHS